MLEIRNYNVFGTEGIVTVNEIQIVLSRMGPQVSYHYALAIIKSLETCKYTLTGYEAHSDDFFNNYLLLSDKTKEWMSRTGNKNKHPNRFFQDIAEWYGNQWIAQQEREWR